MTTAPPPAPITASVDFRALLPIADAIEMFEAPWRRAVSKNDLALMTETARPLNAAIVGFVEQIAKITNNSPSHIGTFAPRNPYDAWFSDNQSPSAFLRCVAQHQSFNRDYWAACERAADRAALLASIDPTKTVVGVELAAKLIHQGRVPHVTASDGKRQYGYLCPLEIALLAQGDLENYDATHRDRVATTKPLAFIVHAKDSNGLETQELNFWPAHLSRSQIERTLISENPEAFSPSSAHAELRPQQRG